MVGVEVAEGLEVIGKGSCLASGPGVKGSDKLTLVNQTDLQGQKAEQEVAVDFGGHG